MLIKNVLLRTINQKNKFVNLAATSVRFNHEQKNHHQHEKHHRNYRKTIATILFSSVIFAKDVKSDVADTFEAGLKKPGLPTYTAEEVSKHDSKESFWVTYKHGVYDVTKFLPAHPGGEQINNAAGLSIEPFWNVYAMHRTKEVYMLLESYRIGNLHDDDIVDHSGDELWLNEPRRDKRLIVKTSHPFNAETPAKLQVEHFDTPNEVFFVRQHMPVPELEEQGHQIKITLVSNETRSTTLDIKELMNTFPHAEVRAALMCAGNRRTEMKKQVKPVKGIDWQQGAISNAVWSGVYLRDVLVYCGVDTSNTAGMHVIFTGSDIDATGVNFSTSIPLDQALNPNGKIVLATHMNGEILPKDHGYPLRVIVPGAPAVRSVKWLEGITISREESPSHWHQKDYRSFNASIDWNTADFSTAPPIYSLPVTSAICDPADDDEVQVKDGCIEVRGYAYSGGGNKIVRVDISPDEGNTWIAAQDLQCDDAPPNQHYSWTLYTARIPVQEGQTEMELWAKATDSNFNTQPEGFDHIYNVRGILANAYHRIKVRINPLLSSSPPPPPKNKKKSRWRWC